MVRVSSRSTACVVFAIAVTASACARSARQYYDSGNRYFEKKQFREAVIEYRNAVQQDPKFGEARYRLAQALVQLGDSAGATGEYVRAADLLPDKTEVQLTAGSVLLASGRFEDARTRGQNVLARDPKNVQAQILVANAAAGLNDLETAITQIEETVRLAPADTSALASLGLFQLIRGNRAEAEAAFRKAVETDPKSVRAHLALANFFWFSGRRADAEQALKQASALSPADTEIDRALAAFYIAANRAAEAEPHLKNIAERTKAPWARLYLADYYVAMQRNAEALTILNALAADRALSALAKSRIAAIQYATGRTADAHKTIDEVLSRDPSNSNALLVKARFLFAEKKLDEALVRARGAATANPRSVEAEYLLGSIYGARNDFDEAISAYHEVLKLNPRAAPAQLEIARLRLAKGETDLAIQAAERAAQIEPGNPTVLLALTRILMAGGDLSRAEAVLKNLFARYPDAAPVVTRMGEVQVFKKDQKAARQSFERALQLDPNYRDALWGLIGLDLSAKKTNDARARVEAALAKAPSDPELLLLAARTFAATGDTARSEDSLKKVIELDPSNLQAYGMLAQLYLSQQKLDQAMAGFEEVAKRQTRPVGAHTMVGMILEAQGKKAEAQKRYERVLEIDQHAPVAANNLAWLYAEGGGNLDVALQLAQTAKQGLPDQPEVNDTLGWIFYKKGLPALAIPPLQQAVDKTPQNPAYHYHLGLAYLGTGDKSRAKASLGQALKLNPNFEGAAEARRALGTL